jgi:hypothetical protein
MEIKPGNIQTVRGRLWRLENYLAVRIWDATPSSYVVHDGENSSDMRLDALEHKPLQQLVWIQTGLPFRERPDECKRIVRELWPRGQHASSKLSEQKISYLLKKKRV